MHFGHVLKPGPALLKQPAVHVHDEIIVFGMDHAEPAGTGHRLKHFPHVAEINHPPASAGRDVGGENLDRRITGLDDFRDGIDQFQRHSATQHHVIGVIAMAASLPVLITAA